MIAIVHSTIFGDKLEETLTALLAGEYRLRSKNPTDLATEGRITTTLEPKTLVRNDFGLKLSIIDLMEHVDDAGEATAVAHAVECLSARRMGIDAYGRIEEALATIMEACIGSVPDAEHCAIDVATATPWRSFSTAWWRDDVGPRDGTTAFEPAVPVDDIIPPSVLIDHYVDADGHGHVGMAPIRSTVHVTRLDPDPVRTLRSLVDLQNMPITRMSFDQDEDDPTEPIEALHALDGLVDSPLAGNVGS